MPTISEALAVAIQHHQAGGLREAESIYRQILDADPQHSDAWHLLGVSACQAGNPRAGVECIRRALMHRPNWGLALQPGQRLGRPGESRRGRGVLPPRLTLQPQYPDANFNLGRIFKVQGKLDEAVACYQRAAQGKPDYTRAHYNLGVLWQAQGKLDAAASAFRAPSNWTRASLMRITTWVTFSRFRESWTMRKRVISGHYDSAPTSHRPTAIWGWSTTIKGNSTRPRRVASRL